MEVYNLIKKSIVCICLFLYADIQGVVVGSTSSGSVPGNTVFPFVDTNNTLLGLAYFSNGFSLGNPLATCIFNDFFPVSSSFDLRGGSLSLSLDLKTDALTSFISTGTIMGNSRSISLPATDGNLSFPASTNPLIVNGSQTGNTTGNNSLDWGVTNTNITVGGTNVGGIANFRILGYNGSNISTDASGIVSNPVNCVRWHPTLSYIAFGKVSGGGTFPLEVTVFSYNAGVLTATGGEDLGGSSSNAVAWRQDGLFLAASSTAAATGLRMYSFNPSTGATALLTTAATTGVTQTRAMDWEVNRNFVVVGTATSPQLQTYNFNGVATLTAGPTNAVGFTVNSVSCSSLAANYIAVGLTGSTTNIRVYQHNVGGATVTQVASVSESNPVTSVNWSPDGTKLAVGLSTAATTQFRVYTFDANTLTLTLQSVANYVANVNDVRWSRDGTYIATADANTSAQVNLVVYSVGNSPFVINNASLILNSDISITQPIIFQGYCEIQGNGYSVDISAINSFSIASTSTLVLNNVKLQGISGTNVTMADNTGLLQLEGSTWVQNGNYTFSRGSLRIFETNTFQGSFIFSYQSTQTSTILSNSTMFLDQGFTFSYDPTQNPVSTLLAFTDSTSQLSMLNSTLHATMQGLSLTKGSLFIDRNCTLRSETQSSFGTVTTDNGITFGDAISSANDFAITLNAGALLQLTSGSLNYKNINSSSWNMVNTVSSLSIGTGTTLNLYKTLSMGSGFVQFANNAALGRASGALLNGSSSVAGVLQYLNI